MTRPVRPRISGTGLEVAGPWVSERLRQPLTVDLTDRTIESWEELWDALAVPCGLPDWFGRNLDAWWDAIQGGGISERLDSHTLLVRLRRSGLFGEGSDGHRFVEDTNLCDYARAEVIDT